MKRTFQFSAIIWDTDGYSSKKLGLPKEFLYETEDSDFDPEMEGADVLSDKFGFCVKSFEFQEIK